MNNPNMTIKERNLLKGAIRRVFSRSEIRKKIIESSIILEHVDSTRPRVKRWCWCKQCCKYIPKSYMQADHEPPIVPINKKLEDMTWDELINNLWCDIIYLKPICKDCHLSKTKVENKLRRKNK